MNLDYLQFHHIDLSDPFFDSLKSDYAEFSDWFQRKANDWAYVFHNEQGRLDGFLYLKIEEGPLDDVTPHLPAALRLKIGTFKINPHGTRLGERFIKKAFDHALHSGVDEIYVTVFEHHQALIQLFDKYGFSQCASKHTANGTETVRIKSLFEPYTDTLLNYPSINNHSSQPYLLALQPQWHTRLLPDSILHNEDSDIIQDVSHTNSIHKVYLCSMPGVERVQRGDPIVIYRTSDNQGPAEYRSVATSICAIEEYRPLHSFSSKEEFMTYCRPYSVFSDSELDEFWNKKTYRHVIRFTYNVALNRRVIRKNLADDVGLDRSARWGFMRLSPDQFEKIALMGGVNESLIVNQAGIRG